MVHKTVLWSIRLARSCGNVLWRRLMETSYGRLMGCLVAAAKKTFKESPLTSQKFNELANVLWKVLWRVLWRVMVCQKCPFALPWLPQACPLPP